MSNIVLPGEQGFIDGLPLKGVRAEHLADKLIVAGHLNSSLLGLVGDLAPIQADVAAAAGTSGRLADAAHRHLWTTDAPAALVLGITNTEGSSANGARADHGHSTEELPWGLGTNQRLTASDSARAPGAATDMTITGGLLSGRWTALHLHSQVTFGTAGFNAVECVYEGTVIGQFFTENTGTNERTIDAWIIFEASSTDLSATFTVENNAASSGNCTLVAGADNPRTFTQFDLSPGP